MSKRPGSKKRAGFPADVAERLFETGLFNLMRPQRFGGFGVSPRYAWEATFNIASGCSSSAWLAGLTSANIIMLGKFSADAQREIFAPGVSPIVPMLTGGVGQDIKIEPAEGGIVLSGTMALRVWGGRFGLAWPPG